MMGNSYGQYGYNPYQNLPNSNQQIMQTYADRLNQYQNQIQQMQPQYQQMQQSPQQPMSNIDWLIVEDRAKAENMIVQPNQTIWSRDSKLPKIYVKTVSNTGMPDFHSFTLIEDIEPQVQIQQQETMVDLSGYVPIETFNKEIQELKDKVMEYEDKLSELTKPKTTTTPSTRKEASK